VRPGGRVKPILLAAAMAFLALNVWTGSPLLAVWLGSRVQGEESQPSMGAFAVVIIALIAFSYGLYQLLKLTMRAYQEATGTTPTVRTHAPWLRSMRGERPDYSTRGASISGAERVVVVTVLVAAIAFEIWFFFFSGSPIGGGGR
jgi:predicted secreted protein